MRQPAAQELLRELLSLLPNQYWVPLYPNNECAVALPDIFKRPRAEIEALLVNANVCKVNGRWNNISLNGKGWESFKDSLHKSISVGDFRRHNYVSNVRPTNYPDPIHQIQAKARCPFNLPVHLPQDIIMRLKESAVAYDAKHEPRRIEKRCAVDDISETNVAEKKHKSDYDAAVACRNHTRCFLSCSTSLVVFLRYMIWNSSPTQLLKS